MAASLSIRPRSSHRSIAGASNPAVADWCCAAPQSVELSKKRATSNKLAALCAEVGAGSQGRNHSSSTETAASKQIVPHLVAPSTPTSSIIPPDHSLGIRPSSESTKSCSTTGSSVRSNKSFDSPLCSPLWDSPQTSPEQADPIENKAVPFKCQPRNKHRATHDKSQEAYEMESPARAAGKRKKASSKDRVPPPLQEEASPSSNRLKPPVTERLRSSSAPSVPSPYKFKSSSIDPISLEVERYLIPGIANLNLKDKDDKTRSPRTARAASASLVQPTGESMGRSSSVSGRVEQRVTTEVKGATLSSGLDSKLGGKVDWEVSPGIQQPKPGKDSHLDTSAPPSAAKIEEQDGAKSVPKDSSISSSSIHITATEVGSRRSGTTLPMLQETIEIVITQTIHHTPGNSPPRVIRLVDRPSDHPRSSSAQQSPVNAGSTAGDVLEADIVPEADTESEADVVSEADTESEADNVSEADIVSEADTVSDIDAVPAADDELQYPVFERYHAVAYQQKDIQAELIRIINPKFAKMRAANKLERGYIYVLSFPSRIRAAGAGTEQKYEYFKVGYTRATPIKRILQQNKCGFPVIAIPDEKQRSFNFAGIVDDLIKCDLREYRRRFPCKFHTRTKAGASCSKHGEWYECEVKRVLDCIEKWRGWVTKCDPFDPEGLLKPRWVWKLAILDQGKDGVDLDSVIQPFTWVEDLLYSMYWLTQQCRDLYAKRNELSTVMKNSPLLVFLSLFGLSLFYAQGLQPSSVCLALLVTIAVI